MSQRLVFAIAACIASSSLLAAQESRSGAQLEQFGARLWELGQSSGPYSFSRLGVQASPYAKAFLESFVFEKD